MDRPLTPQEMMSLAVEKTKAETKKHKEDSSILKAYPLIAPAFGLTAKQVKDRMYEVENLKNDFVKELKEIFPKNGLNRVRVYPSLVKSIGNILTKDIIKTPLWKFLLDVWEECDGLPIILFKIKGYKEYFVLANDNGQHRGKTLFLIPRILIPTQNSNNVFIYTLDVYIKEMQSE
jgi:hypothetical protein